MQELKKRYAEWQAAKQESDRLDDLYEADPENEKLEKEWNAAYQEEFIKFKSLAKQISKMTGMDVNEAGLLIRKKPQELKNLISRIA